jgi:hypothetical protein
MTTKYTDEQIEAWRAHSVLLNSMSWRIGQALGRIPPGEIQMEMDIEQVMPELELLIQRAVHPVIEANRLRGATAPTVVPVPSNEPLIPPNAPQSSDPPAVIPGPPPGVVRIPFTGAAPTPEQETPSGR